MKPQKLGSLCKITSGGTPSRNKLEYFANGDIPWVKTGDLGKKYISEPLEKITRLGLENSSAKIFPAKTVLVAMYGATIGSCAILGFEASTNQACAAFLPTDGVNCEYLYYFLKSIKRKLIGMGQGGGQPNISAGLLKEIEILLPPPEDQIRIAHLLGKVEGLAAQRKQHLQQLDDLLKSVFLEMFGDPIRNDKGWDIQPCEKAVLDISSGTSYGGEDRAFVSPDEVGVLKISAVTKGIFDPTEFKVVSPAQITKTLRFVKSGDFLFSRANTVELVAACCLVSQDYARLFLPDKLWVLTLNSQLINPQFFNYLLKNERYRDVVRSLASGGHDSMLNISMKNFKTLGIPCPLINLQDEFALIVEKTESIKTSYQQSLTDLEALYGVLSRQAFKGELDLSRVSLPKDVTQPMPVDASILIAEVITSTELVGQSEQLEEPLARDELLAQWFRQYLVNTVPATGLRAAEMLESAWQALKTAQLEVQVSGEEEEDEEEPPDLADYDMLKALVFKALDAGELLQTFDDDRNRVALKRQSAEWGAW